MQRPNIAAVLAIVVLLIAHGATSFSAKQQQSPICIDRTSFLNTAASSFVGILTASTVLPSAAVAKDDPSLKGTKEDPAYQGCMSQCLYDCTKPKVEEQKSRAECIPECKKKCATDKKQLMLGTPAKN